MLGELYGQRQRPVLQSFMVKDTGGRIVDIVLLEDHYGGRVLNCGA